jgi:parallel beta-helix repeat protein
MRKHSFSLLLVCLVAIGFACPVARGDALHDQISIGSDDDLHAGNGVTSGSGSVDDPYIIDDWSIEVRAGAGIEVKNTSAYLIIRNCTIVGKGRTVIGIIVSRASHVEVNNCKLTDLAKGIFVYQSPMTIVDGNSCTNCIRGIEGTESNAISIVGNKIDGALEHGIFLWRCHDALLASNTTRDGRNGLYLDSCHRDDLRNNYVKGMEHGVFLWDSFDCSITENTIQDCGLGLAVVHTSEGNLIFHNAFLNNDRPATCDEIRNSWDGGYPTGGNFWEGDPASDVFSGENQDQVGADGISDTSRDIPFNNVDRYPLMEQPVAENEI